MTAADVALLAGAGLAAGTVNAVAGGGSLLSFPALLAAGYPALTANATNMVAVLPGYLGGVAAYQEEVRAQRERARRLALVSGAGGAAGAGLLLVSPAGLFEAIVPYLVLGACALLAVQPLAGRVHGDDRRGTTVAVFLAAVYGGYFGAALGVMLLAILGLVTSMGLQEANGVKGLLSLVIGGVAAVLLGVFGPVAWGAAAVMAGATLIGGRLGGSLARRLSATVLRWAVVAIGVALAVTFFI